MKINHKGGILMRSRKKSQCIGRIENVNGEKYYDIYYCSEKNETFVKTAKGRRKRLDYRDFR